MKLNYYTAWIEQQGKKDIVFASICAFTLKEAKIHAQSIAIRNGSDYKLVKVAKDD